MPRPGPRPYECVRRAWHSERHQPMRGSLIHEIFRVVNETHSSATKKNKEWQAKLPVVVLKAEEIMYSKANSEAEYMDFKTLWDRANDAINTIIRREENNETGDLLPPCIEAALVLGCTPRRASRSQRNSNPRCYLSSSNQEPTSNPPRVPDSVAHGGSSSNLPPLHSCNPLLISYDSSVGRQPLMLNPRNQLHFEASCPITKNNIPNIHRELPSENIALSVNDPISPMQTSPLSTSGRVYPSFYGTQRQTREPQFGFQTLQVSHSISNSVLHTPHVELSLRSNPRGILHNLFSCDEPLNASNRIRLTDLRGTTKNPGEIECDLSLRLGVGLAPWASAGTSRTQEVEEIYSSSQDGSKSSDPSQGRDKGFCFFPRSNADEPLESSSSKWSSEGEGQNLESPNKKQKGAGGISTEDLHFAQQAHFPPNMFFGRMKKPDT